MKIQPIIPLLLLAIVLMASCSSAPRTELHNLPSMVEIVSLNLSETHIKIRVSHRNRHTRKNNQLSCQLAIKDHEVIEFNAIPIPDLTTYAVETVNINLSSNELPDSLSDDDELPYALDCFLFSENFRKEHVIKTATLFSVPGTTGEYR